jgi:two-component system cell cycle response regulator DivK
MIWCRTDSELLVMEVAVRMSANPLTILVVDDFDDTRLLLRTWLERKGFRVIEAENGNEAVLQAVSHAPDLIIMDVEMPELDGLSATRQIRSSLALKNVPVVAVSAYGAQQFRREALAAGCNEYVSTPFEPEDLEKVIRSFLPPQPVHGVGRPLE